MYEKIFKLYSSERKLAAQKKCIINNCMTSWAESVGFSRTLLDFEKNKTQVLNLRCYHFILPTCCYCPSQKQNDLHFLIASARSFPLPWLPQVCTRDLTPGMQTRDQVVLHLSPQAHGQADDAVEGFCSRRSEDAAMRLDFEVILTASLLSIWIL